MYINDSVSNMTNSSTSFGQALQKKLAMNSKPLTITDIKASTNPVSASIVNQATGIVDSQKMALQPVKESGAIITSSNQKSSFLDNKYLLYGGIGVLALGIIYFMTQD